MPSFGIYEYEKHMAQDLPGEVRKRSVANLISLIYHHFSNYASLHTAKASRNALYQRLVRAKQVCCNDHIWSGVYDFALQRIEGRDDDPMIEFE